MRSRKRTEAAVLRAISNILTEIKIYPNSTIEFYERTIISVCNKHDKVCTNLGVRIWVAWNMTIKKRIQLSEKHTANVVRASARCKLLSDFGVAATKAAAAPPFGGHTKGVAFDFRRGVVEGDGRPDP